MDLGRVSLLEMTGSFKLHDGIVGGHVTKNNRELLINRAYKSFLKGKC